MHTFQQNQSVSETVAPPVGATVSPAPAAIAHDEKTIAVLLEVAENEEQKRRVIKKIAWCVLCFSLTFLLATFCCLPFYPLFRLLHSPAWLDKFVAAAALLSVAPVYLFNFIVRSRGLSKENLQKAAAYLLQFTDDPRFLLPFIDTLNTAQTPEEKSQAYPLLTERLWNLSATDAALSFDDTRRTTLRVGLSNACWRLRPQNREENSPENLSDLTTDLAVAIMKTLAGIGDKKSVKVLEKIIKVEATTPNETVVRDAAREYLPALVQRATENDAVHTKLRLCASDTLRAPQKAIADFVDTLAPENAKAVLVEFLRVQKQHDERFSTLMCAGALGVSLFCCLSLFRVFMHDAGLIGAIWPFLGVLVGIVLAFAIARDSKGGLYYAGKITVELSRRIWDDTRIIPFLLSATRGVHDPHYTDTVKKALTRLLPLLQPGDAALVPPVQRAYLRSWLKLPRNKKKAGSGSQTLTIIALDALAAVGDTKALPAAAHIARQTRNGNYRETELHEAAVRCVAALEGRKG